METVSSFGWANGSEITANSERFKQKIVHEISGGRYLNGKRHVRKVPHIRLQDVRQQIRNGGVDCPELKSFARQYVPSSEPVFGRFHQVLDLHPVIRKRPSFHRQPHMPVAPVEESHPQRTLQVRHAAADGRLRHVQFACRPAETALACRPPGSTSGVGGSYSSPVVRFQECVTILSDVYPVPLHGQRVEVSRDIESVGRATGKGRPYYNPDIG